MFGTLVIVPPQAWFGAMTNAGYHGGLFAYLASPAWHFDPSRPDYIGLASPAHLWFILFLLLIALMTQPILSRWCCGGSRMARLTGRLAKAPGGLLAAVVLALPRRDPAEIGGKAFFRFAAFFALGFLLFAADGVAERLEQQRWFWLVLGLGTVAAKLALNTWGEATPDPSLARVGHTHSSA